MTAKVARLSAYPKVVSAQSPVTGRLTVYTKFESLHMVNRETSISDAQCINMKNQVNSELGTQHADGWCEDFAFIPEDVGGWIWTINYVPESDVGVGRPEPISGAVSGAVLATYLIITAIIAAAAIAVAFFIWQIVMPQYPKLYWGMNPDTGQYELMTREQKVTSEQILHPGWVVDPTTGTALNPNDPNYEDQVTMLYERTPEDWGKAANINTSWENIVNLLIIGAVAIGGVVVAVKVLPSFLKKSEETK